MIKLDSSNNYVLKFYRTNNHIYFQLIENGKIIDFLSTHNSLIQKLIKQDNPKLHNIVYGNNKFSASIITDQFCKKIDQLNIKEVKLIPGNRYQGINKIIFDKLKSNKINIKI